MSRETELLKKAIDRMTKVRQAAEKLARPGAEERSPEKTAERKA